MIRWLKDPDDREMLALMFLPLIGCATLAAIAAGFIWAAVAAVRWGLS